MRGCSGTSAALMVVLCLSGGGTRAAVEGGDIRLPEHYESVAECDGMRAADPAALEPYQCYWNVAGHRGQYEASKARLEELRAADPDDPRVALYLGLVIAYREGLRAETLFRQAIDGFEAAVVEREAAGSGSGPDSGAELAGAVYALTSLALNLKWQRRLDEVPPLFDRAMEHARRAGDADLESLVLMHRAGDATGRMEHGTARSLYRHIDARMGPQTSFFVRVGTLEGLAYTAWAMGRYREALETYRRLAELRTLARMPRVAASDLFNVALLAGLLLEEGGMTRDEVESLCRRAVEAAEAAGHPALEAKARLNLAEMPWVAAGERRSQVERALELATAARDDATRSFGLRVLAGEKAASSDEGERAEALPLIEEALGLARDIGDLEQEARGLRARSLLLWQLGRGDEARQAAMAALDAIERLRDLQRDETVRAGWFGRHAYFYDVTVSHLLQEAAAGGGATLDSDGLATAFRVLERKRARTLLDRLDAAGAATGPAASATAARRREALAELEAILKRLPRPDLTRGERDELLARMAELESEERRMRRALAEEDPAFAGLRAGGVAELAEIRETLARDEAILSYVLPAEGVAGWVLAVTRQTARAHPLPSRDGLRAAVQVYMGLLRRRDGLDRAASARLYDDLLAEPLAGLPPGIERLLIVPDGELHRLPLEALRPGPDAAPLGVRFRVERIPSATIWLHWRRHPIRVGDAEQPSSGRTEGGPEATRGPVLALADPGLPDRAAESEAWLRLSDAVDLGALPHAREEAAAAVDALGGILRTGPEASESWLKTADLQPFRLLHFATHAVLDEARPENSLILMAPGSRDEDGLLSLREIVDLRLGGQAVILSACSSAGGALLQGEGPMGPARAFFQADARAVLGSLWPLRDDEAERLVTALYRRLAAGLDLGEALRAVRRELVADGAGTAAWAGLVLIGDGDLTFAPVRSGPGRSLALGLAALSLLALAGLALGRRRARR